MLLRRIGPLLLRSRSIQWRIMRLLLTRMRIAILGPQGSLVPPFPHLPGTACGSVPSPGPRILNRPEHDRATCIPGRYPQEARCQYEARERQVLELSLCAGSQYRLTQGTKRLRRVESSWSKKATSESSGNDIRFTTKLDRSANCSRISASETGVGSGDSPRKHLGNRMYVCHEDRSAFMARTEPAFLQHRHIACGCESPAYPSPSAGTHASFPVLLTVSTLIAPIPRCVSMAAKISSAVTASTLHWLESVPTYLVESCDLSKPVSRTTSQRLSTLIGDSAPAPSLPRVETNYRPARLLPVVSFNAGMLPNVTTSCLSFPSSVNDRISEERPESCQVAQNADTALTKHMQVPSPLSRSLSSWLPLLWNTCELYHLGAVNFAL